MINALTLKITKTSLKFLFWMQRLFYPLKYVLEKRDIAFDEDLAIIIKLMPEDLKYPASVKMTDAGVLRDYKIEVAINNQHPETIDQLENLVIEK
jgi:hypothetical protein